MKVKFVFKHVICLLLVIALSLGFGGCERKNPGSAESVNAETSEAVTESTEGTAEITEATVDPTEVVSNEETTPGLAGTQTTEVDNQVADTVPDETTTAPVTAPAQETQPAETTPQQETTQNVSAPPQPTNPPAPAHEHSYTKSYVPPACETFGYNLYTCSCGHSYKEEDQSVPPNSHKYTCVYSPDPNDFWSEFNTLTCEVCGYSYTTTVHAREIDPAILDQIEERTIYYINQYRQAEGVHACAAPYTFQLVANYRAQQLLSNFAHSATDLRNACAAYQYGKFVDATEFGDDASLSYYTFGGAEAIANGFQHGGIDETAKFLADLIYGSTNHWSYIGSAEQITIAVGIAYEPMNIVSAVLVSAENYG